MKKTIIALLLMGSALTFAENQEFEETMPYTSYADMYALMTKHEKQQVDCLAMNMYREAGVESEEGKIAVGLVTMNRVKSKRFPSTVCKVVNQKAGEVCQFSWKCAEKLPPIDKTIYSYTKEIAVRVFLSHEVMQDITHGAMFFHAKYIDPSWTTLKKTVVVGQHVFYKPKEKNDRRH